MEAKYVVLCCGAWMSQIEARGFEIPSIIPVKGQAIEIDRISSDVGSEQPIVKRDKAYVVD